MSDLIEPDNVAYFSYRNERVPVDKSVVDEIKLTATEAQLDPAEFLNEIVEKTYEKLNDEKLKARQKREELLAKLQALQTRGLQQVSKLVEAELNPATSVARPDERTRNERRSSSVSSVETQPEGRFKVSGSNGRVENENENENERIVSEETARINDIVVRNDNSKNDKNDGQKQIPKNNNSNKNDDKDQDTSNSYWAPMFLNNLMLSNFGNICQNMITLRKEEEFGSQKRQLKLVLRGQGLEDLISKKVPFVIGLPEVAIRQREAHVLLAMLAKIDKPLKEFVINSKTPLDLIVKLKQICVIRTPLTNTNEMRKQLEMKLTGNQSAREFILKFEGKVNKLVSNGLKIDESLKMHTLFHGIPKRFERVHLRMAKPETPTKPKPTFDQLKAMIIEEELVLNSLSESNEQKNESEGTANFANKFNKTHIKYKNSHNQDRNRVNKTFSQGNNKEPPHSNLSKPDNDKYCHLCRRDNHNKTSVIGRRKPASFVTRRDTHKLLVLLHKYMCQMARSAKYTLRKLSLNQKLKNLN